MNDIWNKQREKLEEALKDAALNLAAHTGCYGFSAPIPGTTPPLVITLSAVVSPPSSSALTT